ncbi:MAG: hypothetical protein F4Z16_06610 [Rhodothermaceae bacterium]|nr:hypothetical protein [Rhodothermaceae bacterium]MYD66844.1 hypothetical protein [Rhodothermaceae bacterium]MYI78158.1 hypothetical protein [Gammaproteobacteria bacterium]
MRRILSYAIVIVVVMSSGCAQEHPDKLEGLFDVLEEHHTVLAERYTEYATVTDRMAEKERFTERSEEHRRLAQRRAGNQVAIDIYSDATGQIARYNHWLEQYSMSAYFAGGGGVEPADTLQVRLYTELTELYKELVDLYTELAEEATVDVVGQ